MLQQYCYVESPRLTGADFWSLCRGVTLQHICGPASWRAGTTSCQRAKYFVGDPKSDIVVCGWKGHRSTRWISSHEQNCKGVGIIRKEASPRLLFPSHPFPLSAPGWDCFTKNSTRKRVFVRFAGCFFPVTLVLPNLSYRQHEPLGWENGSAFNFSQKAGIPTVQRRPTRYFRCRHSARAS
jgi:hypothetical protein